MELLVHIRVAHKAANFRPHSAVKQRGLTGLKQQMRSVIGWRQHSRDDDDAEVMVTENPKQSLKRKKTLDYGKQGKRGRRRQRRRVTKSRKGEDEEGEKMKNN